MPSAQPQLAKLFSERLRTARILRGLTQRTLGKRASVSPSSVGRFEIGTRMPNVETLRRLGEALDVATDYLLGLVDAPSITRTDPMEQIVGRDFNRLSDSDRELVGNFFRMLVKRNETVHMNGEEPNQISLS